MQLTAALVSPAENLAWSQAGGHTGMMVSANQSRHMQNIIAMQKSGFNTQIRIQAFIRMCT
jgi:hypothetical protein